jgi:predicted ATPase
MVSGWGARATGDPQEGLALMREGADLFRAVGQRAGLSHRANLAEAMIGVGALDEGLEVVLEALRQAEETGEAAFVAELLRLHGEVLARRAEHRDAEACLRRALAHASAQGAWIFALRAAVGLVQLAAATGAPKNEPLARLEEVAARLGRDADGEDVRAARALLAAGPGPPPGSRG